VQQTFEPSEWFMHSKHERDESESGEHQEMGRDREKTERQRERDAGKQRENQRDKETDTWRDTVRENHRSLFTARPLARPDSFCVCETDGDDKVAALDRGRETASARWTASDASPPFEKEAMEVLAISDEAPKVAQYSPVARLEPIISSRMGRRAGLAAIAACFSKR
jgi:hypothetical protein